MWYEINTIRCWYERCEVNKIVPSPEGRDLVNRLRLIIVKRKPKKPQLTIVGSENDTPTLDDLITLTKALTGRDPTPEEIADAQAILDEPDED